MFDPERIDPGDRVTVTYASCITGNDVTREFYVDEMAGDHVYLEPVDARPTVVSTGGFLQSKVEDAPTPSYRPLGMVVDVEVGT